MSDAENKTPEAVSPAPDPDLPTVEELLAIVSNPRFSCRTGQATAAKLKDRTGQPLAQVIREAYTGREAYSLGEWLNGFTNPFIPIKWLNLASFAMGRLKEEKAIAEAALKTHCQTCEGCALYFRFKPPPSPCDEGRGLAEKAG